MKERSKQGGSRPPQRDHDPPPRKDVGSDEARGVHGDDLNQPSEPRQPFDESNIGDDESTLGDEDREEDPIR